MHVPSPNVCKPQFFQANRIDGICPENPCQQLYFSVHRVLPTELSPKLFPTVSLPSTVSSFPYRSFPPELSPSYFPRFRKLFARFPLRPACCLAPSQRSSPQAICTVSCPSSMLSRSLPAKLSASYLHSFQSVQHAVSLPPSEAFRKLFARFPLRPACCLAPSQRRFPQAICTVSSPSSMLSRSLPAKLSASYFHGFLSVQQAISTVSCPSSMLSRSLPAKLPPSYFHGFLSVQHAASLPPSKAFRKLFARFPVRPACCLAPSQRSSPQAISTASCPSSMLSRSLPANLSQAICTVSSPSSMLSRSLPAKLSASYLHGFQSVQHAVSLPPSEAFRKLFARFRLRSACCLAPSQRSSPQAICTVSSPSSMLSRSLPAKLSASYFHGFLSVQHAVSLPPSEAPPKLFPRLPVRPACCLAPSQRSFPQAICTVSSPSSMLSRSPQRSFPQAICTASSPSSMLSRFPQTICTVSSPSSMLSRSLPAKLSASYFHGFLSVQHAVSLPPGEALRELFPRFPLRPACCLAPSQRSSPQAICTVSSPSSMLSRSLPAKLSPSYFHGFLSVQHAVSLPPSEAFRKLFARFPLRPPCCLASFPAKLSPSYFHGFLSVQHAVSLPPSEDFRKLFARFPVRPACCLAPSQRNSPQAISTVSSPSSMLSRSLPAKLSASYFHGFLSVQHAASLPPAKLSTASYLHPACCFAPSRRSSPQAISTVSSPSSMLSRSLTAKLSASYLHGFLSVQHAVSLPPSEDFRKLFARFPVRPACCLAPSQRNSPLIFPPFPVRPACCLAPSQRSFPQAICTVSCPSSMLSRSLPAKLSANYLHGFLSVQHAVSLPPSEAFRKLFARFPLRPACCLAFRKLFARFPVRPACCLAPSRRSSPQAICTVSCPSSILSRSLPAKLSPSSLPAKLSASYLHGFLSVQHAVSLPPGEALPKLFARFPVRPACCLAPSQRNSPQAISTFSCPSSMLSRSLSAKLSASYFHVFLSVQHAVSLPPSEALPKLFPPFPVRPACCLAPSQRSFPQAICTVSSPSSMLSRSLPAKLSPIPKLFARFPVRPACCLGPSQRSFPQAICISPSFLPSFLPPFLPPFLLFPFLPSFLPSSLPSFSSPSSLPPSLPASFPPSLPPSLPSFLPSFLLSFLPISVPSPSNTPYRSLATKCLNENPSIGDAFGKNQTLLIYLLKLSVWCSGSREPKNERRIGKMRSLILGWT